MKDEPMVIYKRFAEKLLDSLPADQPKFVELLENENLIGEENKRKMNAPNQTTRGCAACVLQEINAVPFSDEKFYKLLSVMEEYKHGLEKIVQEIRSHLNPGINA